MKRYDEPDDTSCAPFQAFVPNDAIVEQTELFLFFPGLHSDPESTAHLPVVAAHAGHKTLSIAWDTQDIFATRCAEDIGFFNATLGGDCDDAVDCSATMRNEVITGVDHPDTPLDYEEVVLGDSYHIGYEGRYLSSIVQRTARALEHLYAQDMLDSVDDHGWLAYCEPSDEAGTAIDWSQIIVAGHSMGSGMASYIAYTRPTAGLWVADTFGDYCEAPLTNLTTGRLVDYLDAGSPRYLGPSASASAGTFAALHLLSDQLGNTPKLPAPDPLFPKSYDEAGYTMPGIDYDTAWMGSLGSSNLITTEQLSASPPGGTSYHASMAEQNQMPIDFSGSANATVRTGTYQLYLFEGYLAGVCSL